MRRAVRAELRSLLPAWLVCLLLPVPAFLLWHSSDGRNLALGCLFVGGAGLVAYSFGREFQAPSARPAWGVKMAALAGALLAAAAVCSALSLVLNDPADYESPLVALLILVPSLGMVPYLTLRTGKPFAAVVFTVFLVAGMKLVGCAVVWLVYGPDADREGRMTVPFTNPNLLVCVFFVTTGALSVTFHLLGYRQYQRLRFRPAR